MDINKEQNSTITKMVNKIVEKYSPERVILFGSRATGNFKESSDIDLLVVPNCEEHDCPEIMASIMDELYDFEVPYDVIVANQNMIEERKNDWWTVYYPALKEGVVMYEKNGYRGEALA